MTSNSKKIAIILTIMITALLWIFWLPGNLRQEQSEIIQKSHSLKFQDFSLPDLKGQSQSFAQWQGKVVLLNFWATWCPPCRYEMPDFVEVYDQYKDQNFVIIGVGTDDPAKIAKFVEQLNVSYPILVGGREAMQISYQYGNHSGALPYSIIFDQQGNIRYRAGGMMTKKQLLAQIKPLL
ncbi:TlpA family protein disulfide reductase [sulfur-oxidizing endosymbiont of Gigantopelta aegis]|uniref:TlpA family protein disulfide reductase n=1 Tax=sulfur-oxidizing endosymbiont of Gigantopelta aegis TaxID=2794934 RepID=UPI0018DD7C5E|nr:TlpA disulfide reductase family protein [sulfur-oxidizing endosymbiont of Gigantopelta aegis]